MRARNVVTAGPLMIKVVNARPKVRRSFMGTRKSRRKGNRTTLHFVPVTSLLFGYQIDRHRGLARVFSERLLADADDLFSNRRIASVAEWLVRKRNFPFIGTLTHLEAYINTLGTLEAAEIHFLSWIFGFAKAKDVGHAKYSDEGYVFATLLGDSIRNRLAGARCR